jgi:hypothetical protein
VLGHERLADVQRLVQILDGAFAADELLEQADARRMGEGAEELALRLLKWCGHIAISLYAQIASRRQGPPLGLSASQVRSSKFEVFIPSTASHRLR